MINLTINWISAGIGAIGIVFLFGITKIISWAINRKRGYSLTEMKELISGAHEDMFNANTKLRKLYSVFNEVEADLNK